MQENIKIDTKSKVLFATLFVLIIISILATHYRTMVLKDYEIFYTDVEGEEIVEE